MYTNSGSYPLETQVKIVSRSHNWVLKNAERLKESLEIKYRKLKPKDLKEVKALHKEWFPINYSNEFFQSIGSTTHSIAAVVNPRKYGDSRTTHPVIVGMILFRIQVNSSNEHIKFTYMFSVTHSCYIATLGVVEAMRGHGIAKQLLLRCKGACEARVERPLFISLHVITHNTDAIGLYEKLGFQRNSTNHNHYYIDGKYYDGYLYILYMDESASPVLSTKNVSSFFRSIGKLPQFIKAVFWG